MSLSLGVNSAAALILLEMYVKEQGELCFKTLKEIKSLQELVKAKMEELGQLTLDREMEKTQLNLEIADLDSKCDLKLKQTISISYKMETSKAVIWALRSRIETQNQLVQKNAREIRLS